MWSPDRRNYSGVLSDLWNSFDRRGGDIYTGTIFSTEQMFPPKKNNKPHKKDINTPGPWPQLVKNIFSLPQLLRTKMNRNLKLEITISRFRD